MTREFFVPTSALIGTRATPYACYGGKVHSFKIDPESAFAIDGKRLEIRDGHLYANFDEFDMDGAERHFPDCERIGNSFHLGQVKP